MHRTTYGLLAIGIGILLGSSSLAILIDIVFNIQPIGPYAQLLYEKVSIPVLVFLAAGMMIVFGFTEIMKGDNDEQSSGDGNDGEGHKTSPEEND